MAGRVPVAIEKISFDQFSWNLLQATFAMAIKSIAMADKFP